MVARIVPSSAKTKLPFRFALRKIEIPENRLKTRKVEV